ncbi:hypothetical protein [Noviluteimonas dokdonensis]
MQAATNRTSEGTDGPAAQKTNCRASGDSCGEALCGAHVGTVDLIDFVE